MKIDKYLVLTGTMSNYGGLRSIKVDMRERSPKLTGNQIALRLVIDIPDKIFMRPTLEARMSIPEEVIPKNLITPEIQGNIEKIVKEATGLNIAVAIVEHEEPEKEKRKELK